MKNEIQILIGIPASGKTTYAKQLIKSSGSHIRISRDEFRLMFKNDPWPGEEVEDLVSASVDSTIQKALDKGWDIVLDETNCRYARLEQTIQKWGKHARIVLKIIGAEVSLKELNNRNQKRETPIPEAVIDRMYDGFKYVVQNKKQLLDQINTLAGQAVVPVIAKQNESLPKAIIVDIDGTIAKMDNKRGPFEWSKVDGDEPVNEILDIIRALSAKNKVVFMSGRDESCRELTEAWLNVYYGNEPIELYMRPAGNNEKDNIVKLDLFNKHIRDKYYVQAVFDDRDQVVRMWREQLGLKCLQVAYGNF